MNKIAINGTVMADPKVLKMAPLLLFAKVVTPTEQTINCLVHKHGLNFLYQVTTGTKVALYGHYNARKQFVIDKFTVVAQAEKQAS